MLCTYKLTLRQGSRFLKKDEARAIVANLTSSCLNAENALDETGEEKGWAVWTFMEENMQEFSKRYPDVLFIVSVQPKGNDDYIVYFLNGVSEKVEPVKIYPPTSLGKTQPVIPGRQQLLPLLAKMIVLAQNVSYGDLTEVDDNTAEVNIMLDAVDALAAWLDHQSSDPEKRFHLFSGSNSSTGYKDSFATLEEIFELVNSENELVGCPDWVDVFETQADGSLRVAAKYDYSKRGNPDRENGWKIIAVVA